MSTVHAQIEIDAPVQRVWDTVMDPHHLKDWVTIHKSVHRRRHIGARGEQFTGPTQGTFGARRVKRH
jgi:uncharacterized protein YndB with AHSA1/START domain